MAPNMKLPVCGEKREKAILRSGLLPSSAVFVTCTKQRSRDCSNIARAIIDKKTGATVNIILSNKEMGESPMADEIAETVRRARQSGIPINVIPVDLDPEEYSFHSYSRDPGVISTAQGKTNFVALPDMKSGAMVMAKAVRACSDIHVTEAVDVPVSAPDYRSQISNLYKKGRTAGEVLENRTAEGGNFLVLPNNLVLTGRSAGNTVSKSVRNYFGKVQNVAEIDLPNLAVGHIDEVFNVVPSKGACGFAILSASPQKMREFLQDQKNEQVLFSSPPYNQDFEKKKWDLEREYWKLNGRPASDDLKKRIRDAWLPMKDEKIVNRTGAQVLDDPELIEKWDKFQLQINQAKKQIKKKLDLPKGCTDRDLFVDLPVFWDKMGKPKLANPVNGLFVNGTYFYSKQERLLAKPPVFVDEKYVGYENGLERRDFPALTGRIEEILKEKVKADVQSVQTDQYDSGNGNLHCATLNVPMLCKPK